MLSHTVVVAYAWVNGGLGLHVLENPHPRQVAEVVRVLIEASHQGSIASDWAVVPGTPVPDNDAFVKQLQDELL